MLAAKKNLRNCQLLSQTPQRAANHHYTQLIDASAEVTYHEIHIKDLFMSLTGEVLLIWVSLNEGLIASPLNIWFCNQIDGTSDSLVHSTKRHYSPTPASNSITIRAKPAVIAMEHHHSRWFQLSHFIPHACLPLGFTVCKQGLYLPGQGVWAADNPHSSGNVSRERGISVFLVPGNRSLI